MAENNFRNIELNILKNVNTQIVDDTAHNYNTVLDCSVDVLNALLRADFEAVIKQDLVRKIFSSCDDYEQISGNDSEISGLNVRLKECVERFLRTCVSVESEETHLRKLVVLCAGVACLQIYVRNNWVGPPTNIDCVHLIANQFKGGLVSESETAMLNDHVQDYLSIDGDCIYGLSNQPIYLYLARILLNDCSLQLSTLQTSANWLMRCLHVHQQLLADRSPSLKQSVLSVIDRVETKNITSWDKEVLLQFHVEAGHICYFFYEPTRAAYHFRRAAEVSGLVIELTGALGKRTRFQTTDLPQLILQVQRTDINDALPGADSTISVDTNKEVQTNGGSVCVKPPQLSNLPKDISLDDETVLERIQFKEPNDVHVVQMSATEQALVLGLCYQHQRTHEGQGKIVQEESMAYVNCILFQPINWCVQSTALFMRVRWETDSPRRLHRSLEQLQELVNQYKRKDTDECDRLCLVYTVALPPRWAIERELGSILKTIGSMSAALDVYLALHSWDDVIECYAALGHCEKAERLIQDQLVIKPTPSLYCYLGDVTHNPAHYETAWTLSGNRYARAQRCLAYHYLRKHDFERCLHYFEKTLEINSLQTGCWFSLGCAYLSCLMFDKAAVAFRRCVNLDNDNHEAWSNLATAYVRSNNKPRAFATIQEALKWDFENWKIWENYIVVAADLGEFEEVMRAYHRLLELRHKHTDVEILTILVRAVKENLPDAFEETSHRHRPKALDLFGHITSKVTSNADIWRLYAELLTCATDASDMDHERAVQYLQKAQRCATQVKDWEVNEDSRKTACQISVQLANAYLESKDRLSSAGSQTTTSQYLSSARLMLKGVVAKLKKQQLQVESLSSSDLQTSVASQIDQFETLLFKFTEQ